MRACQGGNSWTWRKRRGCFDLLLYLCQECLFYHLDWLSCLKPLWYTYWVQINEIIWNFPLHMTGQFQSLLLSPGETKRQHAKVQQIVSPHFLSKKNYINGNDLFNLIIFTNFKKWIIRNIRWYSFLLFWYAWNAFISVKWFNFLSIRTSQWHWDTLKLTKRTVWSTFGWLCCWSIAMCKQ